MFEADFAMAMIAAWLALNAGIPLFFWQRDNLSILWCNVRWSTRRRREKLVMWTAWHVPRWLAYWCAIRVISHATTGKWSSQVVPELSAMDALKRWEDRS